MKFLKGIIVLAAIMVLPTVMETESVFAAQTPDGQTPAEENICDPLMSATPGRDVSSHGH